VKLVPHSQLLEQLTTTVVQCFKVSTWSHQLQCDNQAVSFEVLDQSVHLDPLMSHYRKSRRWELEQEKLECKSNSLLAEQNSSSPKACIFCGDQAKFPCSSPQVHKSCGFEHFIKFCYLWCSRKLQASATQALSWDFSQNRHGGTSTSLLDATLWIEKKGSKWPKDLVQCAQPLPPNKEPSSPSIALQHQICT
jgi:hypothetical protein